jgi:hypothetical protein
MTHRLTVSEAIKLTGKSESTIKRLLREIAANPTHADRSLIDPSHEEVEKRKAAGDSYVWRIAPELLLKRFPVESTGEASTADSPTGQPTSDLVVTILREQLHSKDEQIRTLEVQLDRKDDQIANLNERQRESNILMKELQQRLAIAPPVDTKSAADKPAKTPWWKHPFF